MTDNPFLAGIAREAVRGKDQQFIIEALEDKFGGVPEEVQQRVRRIIDEDRLRALRRSAVLSESLQAFLDKIG